MVTQDDFISGVVLTATAGVVVCSLVGLASCKGSVSGDPKFLENPWFFGMYILMLVRSVGSLGMAEDRMMFTANSVAALAAMGILFVSYVRKGRPS